MNDFFFLSTVTVLWPDTSTFSVFSLLCLFAHKCYTHIRTSVGVGFFISLTAVCVPKFIMPAFCCRAPKHAS